MMANLIMDVTNSLSIFEFQGCLFEKIESFKFFLNKIPMHQNFSSK